MRPTPKIPLERRRSYARRRKTSACRGITHTKCSFNSKRCSYASGRQRQFCRRKNNTPHTLYRRKTKKRSILKKATRKSLRLAKRPRKDFSIYK